MNDVNQMIETMKQEIFVEDPRPEGDESFGAVPKRLQTFQDLIDYVAELEIDLKYGWEAAAAGEAYWKLAGFHVTVGIRVLSPKVIDQDGNYIRYKYVNFSYDGNPNTPKDGGKPPYFNRGESVKTKWEGNGAEFVIGGEHNVAPQTRGPDSLWVAEEKGSVVLLEPGAYVWKESDSAGPKWSDAVHGLGMRVNTNHLIVSPIFQYTIKDAATNTAPAETLEQALIETGTPQIISLDIEAILFKVSEEKNLGQRLTPEYEIEFGGQTYLAQIYQRGLVYVPKGDWGNVQVIQRSDW